MTFDEWHKANAKYMEPADIVAWCAEAWMAGFDKANEIKTNKEKQVTQDAHNKRGGVMNKDEETVYETIVHWDEGGGKRSRRELARRIVDLYTAPPKREWVGLTVEEVAEAGKLNIEGERMLPYSFARAIEAKLKEKNT